MSYFPPLPCAYRAPEILFDPARCGVDRPSVQSLAATALAACDPTTRAILAGSIILSGGTTLLHGLPQRLSAEIVARTPTLQTVHGRERSGTKGKRKGAGAKQGEVSRQRSTLVRLFLLRALDRFLLSQLASIYPCYCSCWR